jgi:hypothetical protein
MYHVLQVYLNEETVEIYATNDKDEAEQIAFWIRFYNEAEDDRGTYYAVYTHLSRRFV